MVDGQRVVLDTNVVFSGMLFPEGVPGFALLKAQRGEVLGSDATLLELIEDMGRSKFDRYLAREIRQQLVAEFTNACEVVPILYPIRACRDPKDDKFLEVAVHGHANAIVTGDADLLALHPFRGVAIQTPRSYMEMR